MEFQTDSGANLIISFDHLRKVILIDDKVTKIPYHTTCTIKTKCENKLSLPVFYGDGEAKCSVKDNFRYSVGRKLSMTRALKVSGLSKESRKNAWIAYAQDTRCNWSVV